MQGEISNTVQVLSDLAGLLGGAQSALKKAKTHEAIEAVRVEYLGKKGKVSLILKMMGQLPDGDRRELGLKANQVRDQIEELLEACVKTFDKKQRDAFLSESIDVSLPGNGRSLGFEHPLVQMNKELLTVFSSLGFEIAHGPEIEHDFYNFEALNIPKDHPAREMQDTFYIAPEVVLRTQTSPVQIRTMIAQKEPPIRIASPGRVFRRDQDITHSPIFHQIELLYVDKNVSFADLKGTIAIFIEQIFGKGLRMRMRPSYFPFTEPSAEVDMSCFACGQKGCRLCKGSGWIEILGSGMIDPEVLKAAQLDPEKVSGFAVGMGVERLAMLKYGIADIRHFYENDLRFLAQFLTTLGIAMRISLKWLNELVDLPQDLSEHEIGEHLTMAGLEVEGITSVSETMKNVLIGKIQEANEIPKRPQARLCRVDIGTAVISVVTNSKNVNVGDFVVVALPGAKLFDGSQVEARRIFDEDSQGVLCCERELGISDDNSQVLVLSKEECRNLASGQNAIVALELEDTILEVAITPNRPDALSHMGVARELAAALSGRSKFLNPVCREMSGPIHDVLLVNIDARDACPRYAARVIENIRIAKSPLWLRARLYACGVRPINNVVDITNFVLLERGHPLHAFDFQKIAKDRGRVSLNIRLALQGEKLKTLDGVERSLTSEDLVIADARGPIALAGIIGGENSEVGADTSAVLLESAYFNPSTVRRTARRQQVSTEGSYRFERGADPNGVMPALDRAADLMVQYASGKVRRDVIDVYPRKIESIEVLVRPKKLQDISGLPVEELDESRIRSRFALLGIETVGKRGEKLCFRVPTFRPDLTREIDLIEEAMRLIGFGKVPSSTVFSRRPNADRVQDNVAFVTECFGTALKAKGFSNAMNFSFGSPTRYQLFEPSSESELIRVQNPMGEELSAMRKWLLPGLLDNVVLNLKREVKFVQLFEVGTVFWGKSEQGQRPDTSTLSERADFDAWANEKLHVAGVIAGDLEPSRLGQKSRELDFYDMKGAVENCFRQLHVDASLMTENLSFESTTDKWAFLHPGYCAKLKLHGEEIGYIGRVHPDVQNAFELSVPVYCFEIDVRKVAEHVSSSLTMKAIPKYPPIPFDLALLLPIEVSASEIAKEVRAANLASSLIEKFEVFDIYTGKGIPSGKKSIALSFLFRSSERTLKLEEAQSMMAEIAERLKSSFGAEVRK